jgi:hypothetical protein
MTQSELDELCGKHDVTPEMLKKLVSDQAYFEQLFNRPTQKESQCQDTLKSCNYPKCSKP